jgi:integrase
VAGLPRIRPHDLRHTHASVLLRLRTPMKVVQERLGHSTFAITADIYSHVAPDLQEQAAGLFGAALRGGPDSDGEELPKPPFGAANSQ